MCSYDTIKKAKTADRMGQHNDTCYLVSDLYPDYDKNNLYNSIVKITNGNMDKDLSRHFSKENIYKWSVNITEGQEVVVSTFNPSTEFKDSLVYRVPEQPGLYRVFKSI